MLSILQRTSCFTTVRFFAIVLERPFLARAMAETEGRRDLLSDDTAFLQSTAPAPDLGGSVRQAIAPLLPSGYPDIRLVADIAGLSVRTLQRRLDNEGSSYARLVEQVRFETAVRLLHDDRVKLINLALELGYFDPANFTRAFRRWTSASPSEYRRLANTAITPSKPVASTSHFDGERHTVGISNSEAKVLNIMFSQRLARNVVDRSQRYRYEMAHLGRCCRTINKTPLAARRLGRLRRQIQRDAILSGSKHRPAKTRWKSLNQLGRRPKCRTR